MRITIIGNSGSGKSTLARRLAAQHGVAVLELDAIVWEPEKIAVARPNEAVLADLDRFFAEHNGWIIEGCYGELAEYSLRHAPELIFLNPGAEVCRANNLRRPWEPHKYATAEAQDAILAALLEWVDAYYTRTDGWSLSYHRRLYASYGGTKSEITGSVEA